MPEPRLGYPALRMNLWLLHDLHYSCWCSEVRLFLRKNRDGIGRSVYTRSENALVGISRHPGELWHDRRWKTADPSTALPRISCRGLVDQRTSCGLPYRKPDTWP
jgi:hypothetical protein